MAIGYGHEATYLIANDALLSYTAPLQKRPTLLSAFGAGSAMRCASGGGQAQGVFPGPAQHLG